MPKNEQARIRDVNAPYEVYRAGTWEWRVLKKWQADDNAPNARWFCAVKSPATFGGYDLGDVYAKDVMAVASRVTESTFPWSLARW